MATTFLNISAANLELSGNLTSTQAGPFVVTTPSGENIQLTPGAGGLVELYNTYTLPSDAGTLNYVLSTNGTDAATWVDPSTIVGADHVTSDATLGTTASVIMVKDGATNDRKIIQTAIPISAPNTNNFFLNTTNSTVSGSGNISVGGTAGSSLVAGDNNVSVGLNAGTNLTSGSDNVLMGANAGNDLVSASDNTAVGSGALDVATSNSNTALGAAALGAVTTGGLNTAVGAQTAATLTTGTDNVLLGYNANVSAAAGTNQIVIGSGITGKGDNTAVIGGSTNITSIQPGADNVTDLGVTDNRFKDLWLEGNATIAGNLTVDGTTTTINTTQLLVEDNLIKVGNGNTTSTTDLGLYGEYSLDAGTTPRYSGIFVDMSDGRKLKVFTNLTEEPTGLTVNTAHGSYQNGTLVADVLEATGLTIDGTSGQIESTGANDLTLVAIAGQDLTLTSSGAGEINFNSGNLFNFNSGATNGGFTLPTDNNATANQLLATTNVGGDTDFVNPTAIGIVTETGVQTLTNKTLTAPVLTAPEINDTSADHQYIFGVSELTADRTVTLPLLGASDIFVFEAHAQTLTNKTISSSTNTVGANEIRTTGASVTVDASAPPGVGQVLTATSATNATWTTPAGTGDVLGPGSALNNAIAQFDGTTGKLIKDSLVYLTAEATGNLMMGTTVDAVIATGDNNTAFGAGAGDQITTGDNNVAIGSGASGATTGGNNVTIGLNSGAALAGGQQNVAIGSSTLLSGVGLIGNTAVGHNALTVVESDNNTAVGSFALSLLSTGLTNVAVGGSAGGAITTGNNNVCVGYVSDAAATANNQTAIGSNATVSGVGGIAIGAFATATTNQCKIGSGTLNEIVPGNATVNLGSSGSPFAELHLNSHATIDTQALIGTTKIDYNNGEITTTTGTALNIFSVTGQDTNVSSLGGGNVVLDAAGAGRVSMYSAYTFPNADGTAANQALTTDGAGTLSFTDVSTIPYTKLTQTLAGDLSLLLTYNLVELDAGNADRTVTLPTTPPAGTWYIITKTDGALNDNLIITANILDRIGGGSLGGTVTLKKQYDCIRLTYSAASNNWMVL